MGFHWWLPRPFGVDSRYDVVSSRDKPMYRPRAQPMVIRPLKGFKPTHWKEESAMVFDGKGPV